MNKKINTIAVLFITASTVLLTACNSKQESVNEVNLQPAEEISSVEVDNQVEEYEEEKYIFEPAELTCYMPDGFNESTEPGNEGLYLHESYPDDVSTIDHKIVAIDESILDMTEEEFVAQMAAGYYEGYGEKVDIIVTQYDKIVVDGRPGFWIMYNFDFRREHFAALDVILFNGDEAHDVTFLQGPGSDWMEEFINAAKTIGFSPLKQ